MSDTDKTIWEYEAIEVGSNDPKYVAQKCRALQRDGYEIISLAAARWGNFVILVRRMP